MEFSALPTWFDGFWFRSRLEARWALLFKELEIRFWYETQGYTLPDGSRYLPDFYLPQIQMLAEVKGEELTEQEVYKCRSVCAHIQRPILMLVGPPDFRVYKACLPCTLSDGVKEADTADFLLDIDFHKRIYFHDERRLFSPSIGFDKEEDFSTHYRAAVHASRAARFEDR